MHFRLVKKFNEIHRFLIFTFFLWGIFGVCNILLTLQFQLVEYLYFESFDFLQHNFFWFFPMIFISWKANNSKLVEVSTSLFVASWTYIVILLNCESGERVSNAFERFYEEQERCDWHLLSIDTKRLYLTFLLDTQHSIHFKCYGRILCTRETFKTVKSLKIINKMAFPLRFSNFLYIPLPISLKFFKNPQ